MKKISRILFCTTAVALVSAGCVKSEDKLGGKAEGDKSTLVKFYAGLAEEDGTRANINTGDGVFTCNWENGDALGVVPTVPGSTTPHTLAHKFCYNGASFAFEGSLPSSVKGCWEYMAFYPHGDITGTTAHVPFGNLRIQDGNSFNSGFDALVADCLKYDPAEPGLTENNENISFTLKRLTSIVNLKTSVSGSGNARYIRISTEGGEPLSAGSIDFDLAEGCATTAALSATDQSDVIVIGFKDGTAPAVNAIDAFINIPAGNYNNLSFEVITDNAQKGSVSVQRADPSKPFVAGTLYRKQVSDMQFAAVAAPALVWEGQDMNAIHDITVDGNSELTYDASVLITAEAAIAGLEVGIESDVLNALGLQTLDIFNTPAAELEILGLTGGVDVQYKKEVKFDITPMLPLILLLGPEGGSLHTFRVKVTDLAGQQTVQALTFRAPYTGPAAIYNKDADLWANTASFDLVNIPAEAQSVAMEYSIKGTNDWKQATVTADGGNYTAKIEAEWTTGTNDAGLTVHTVDPKTGVFAKNIYEYQLKVDGAVVQSGEFTPENNGGQIIPNGDMESSTMSCWGEANSNAPFWASGNCTVLFVKTVLCRQGTYAGMQGNKCAHLTAVKPAALVKLGAGNLFTGTFLQKPSTTGNVSFGQYYDWQARPSALSVRYWAKIGNVDATQHAAKIANGAPDKARIFVAIVDWSNQHKVSSGTNAPTGTWDPASQTSVTEGNIIAYGSLFIEEQTAGSEMISVDVPIQYYNKTTKPGGNYTLVISCATSAYGDYMNGCTSNVMYVDDFEWVY